MGHDYKPPRLTRHDTSPARPHLLPNQTVPPTGDQLFQHLSLWETCSFKPLQRLKKKRAIKDAEESEM